jgi:hypothetical protein
MLAGARQPQIVSVLPTRDSIVAKIDTALLTLKKINTRLSIPEFNTTVRAIVSSFDHRIQANVEQLLVQQGSHRAFVIAGIKTILDEHKTEVLSHNSRIAKVEKLKPYIESGHWNGKQMHRLNSDKVVEGFGQSWRLKRLRDEIGSDFGGSVLAKGAEMGFSQSLDDLVARGVILGYFYPDAVSNFEGSGNDILIIPPQAVIDSDGANYFLNLISDQDYLHTDDKRIFRNIELLGFDVKTLGAVNYSRSMRQDDNCNLSPIYNKGILDKVKTANMLEYILKISS